ncbi:MAG: HAD-IA family hydrolase [Dehalococcoidales bacterium]|nr:HAD-IA family hydrolase [Dehalococcoidales bacterium]
MKIIKAIFFDWMDTVGHPEIERHDFVTQIFSKFGIEVSPEKLIRPIYIAETERPGGTPYRWDESKDPEYFLQYVELILSRIGVTLPRDTVFQIMTMMSRDAKKLGFSLYDDVLPTMKTLKNNGFILGLITSMKKEINLIAGQLGLEPYLDFTITSSDIRVPKPKPPVFLAALERASVRAAEAIYVGDQYSTDVVGAKGVGISPMLLDRYDLFPEITDCPRIRTLTELPSIIW